MSTVEREKIVVTICGHQFVWERPVRRVCRDILRDIYAVHSQFPSVAANSRAQMLRAQFVRDGEPDKAAEVVVPEIDPIDGLGLTNAALDFLYKWNPAIKVRSYEIDDANETEIAAAFGEVTQFLMRPFVAVQAVRTETQRLESTS